MKTLRILHTTRYLYHSPVTFGTHTAMIRPREGHDLHIAEARLSVEPRASVRWVRDVEDNSLAVLEFSEPSSVLSVSSDVLVEIYGESPLGCLIDPAARLYPFQYSAQEQVEVMPYRLVGFPQDAPQVLDWLASHIYKPGDLKNTTDLLAELNTAIFKAFTYRQRDEQGVQTPGQTLALAAGSCRDYAVFFIEAARNLGFAARFVSGYILIGEGQHGATHAWAEVYVPGSGWRGFDPTNNKPAGLEHVSVAVARDPRKASPLSGTWHGDASAFDRMEVKVEVVAV